MKNLKFWSLLMALVFGLSFGFVSCGDDDDDENTQDSSVVEKTTIEKGQNFYKDLKNTNSDDATAKTAAITSVVLTASEYASHKSDAEWTTNFLAGVAMEKYGVTDAVAKTEEYQNKVKAVKDVLDAGFTADNVAGVLVNLSDFIASK
ncbi:MAG: hypothetical protein IJ916_13540 [Paludibacteraceae bacterium]|nr:hypothetical protein [Paludibacteraceae bacterium]